MLFISYYIILYHNYTCYLTLSYRRRRPRLRSPRRGGGGGGPPGGDIFVSCSFSLSLAFSLSLYMYMYICMYIYIYIHMYVYTGGFGGSPSVHGPLPRRLCGRRERGERAAAGGPPGMARGGGQGFQGCGLSHPSNQIPCSSHVVFVVSLVVLAILRIEGCLNSTL